jgi:hypothetical protein
VKLTSHLCLAPRLRMSRAIFLLPVYFFMAWTGTNLPVLFTLYSNCRNTVRDTAQLVAFVRGIDMACNMKLSN